MRNQGPETMLDKSDSEVAKEAWASATKKVRFILGFSVFMVLMLAVWTHFLGNFLIHLIPERPGVPPPSLILLSMPALFGVVGVAVVQIIKVYREK